MKHFSGYPILLRTRDKLLQHRGQQRADNLISTLHPRTNQCQPFHEPLLRLLKFYLNSNILWFQRFFELRTVAFKKLTDTVRSIICFLCNFTWNGFQIDDVIAGFWRIFDQSKLRYQFENLPRSYNPICLESKKSFFTSWWEIIGDWIFDNF